jgi:hypothetical protein
MLTEDMQTYLKPEASLVERSKGNWDRYRAVLAWLVRETEKTYPEWMRIDRAHRQLPAVWKRWKQLNGYC